MTTLTEIETLCKELSETDTDLKMALADFTAEVGAVSRRHVRKLKSKATRHAELTSQLAGMVEAAPDLFQKPKSVILHGIKVGFRYSNGSLKCEDEDLTLKLIERHLKDRIDELISTTKSPNKAAIKALTATELHRIGCSIDGAGDSVIVEIVDGDVEKFIKKITKQAMAGTEPDAEIGAAA